MVWKWFLRIWETSLAKGSQVPYHLQLIHSTHPYRILLVLGRRPRFNSWVEQIHWRRKWQPTAVVLLENPMDGKAWQAGNSPRGSHDHSLTQRWCLSTTRKNKNTVLAHRIYIRGCKKEALKRGRT